MNYNKNNNKVNSELFDFNKTSICGIVICDDKTKLFIYNRNMVDTHLSLSWDAYQKNICSGLSLLQQRGEFVDMTLAADGHHVKVHQMVLSLVSPYIKDLISSAQCPHPVIFLNNMSCTTLSLILEYVYTGEVQVPKTSLPSLIAAGKALHIKGLKEMDDTNSIPELDYQEDPILELSPPKKALMETLQKHKKNKQNDQKIEKEQKVLEPMCKIFVDVNTDESMEIVKGSTETPDTSCIKKKEETNIISSKLNSLQVIGDKGSTSSISNVQYSLSNQGGLQLIANRYIYTLKYVQKKLIKFWRCSDSAYRKCPANIYTNDKNQIIKRKFTHTHPFHDEKILKKLRVGLVFAAYNEAESQARSKQTDGNSPEIGSSPQDTDSE